MLEAYNQVFLLGEQDVAPRPVEETQPISCCSESSRCGSWKPNRNVADIPQQFSISWGILWHSFPTRESGKYLRKPLELPLFSHCTSYNRSHPHFLAEQKANNSDRLDRSGEAMRWGAAILNGVWQPSWLVVRLLGTTQVMLGASTSTMLVIIENKKFQADVQEQEHTGSQAYFSRAVQNARRRKVKWKHVTTCPDARPSPPPPSIWIDSIDWNVSWGTY